MKMLRSLLILIASTFLLAFSNAWAVAENAVGVRALTADAPHRGGRIDLSLWYPARADGSAETVGASKIFEGVPARRDASPAEGIFPVVLLAHGGLRANPNGANWIAADLVARGYIVVAALAPELGPKDAAIAVREVWHRPGDLSAALTALEQDAILATHIAPKKVAALGFFLGGTSALAVAGARLDAVRYKRSCDGPANGPDCRWFAKNNVDLHKLEDGPISGSHLDERVKTAIAVDPELVEAFVPDADVMRLAVPVSIVGLGGAGIDAQGACRAGVCSTTIADATPFSAFPICTPQGPDLLAAEGEDDTICRETGKRSRADIHRELADAIAVALANNLAP